MTDTEIAAEDTAQRRAWLRRVVWLGRITGATGDQEVGSAIAVYEGRACAFPRRMEQKQ